MKRMERKIIVALVAMIAIASVLSLTVTADSYFVQPTKINYNSYDESTLFQVDLGVLNDEKWIPRNEITSIMYPGVNELAEIMARDELIEAIKNGDAQVYIQGEFWDYDLSDTEEYSDRLFAVSSDAIGMWLILNEENTPPVGSKISLAIFYEGDTWDGTVYAAFPGLGTTKKVDRRITPLASMESTIMQYTW
jgi:hypothetical protein